MTTTDLEISTDSIKLGQCVKLANCVDTGGEAKAAIAEGCFAVNGEVETRRGRTLHPGDVVSWIDGETEHAVRIVTSDE